MRKLFRDARDGFTSTFWVANTLELFERLAFYGSKAVLAVYLAEKIGLGKESAGELAGLYATLIYALPIVAGVFVDRYGFRKTLAACFVLFTAGYFLIGLAGMEAGEHLVATLGKRNYVLAVLALTAMGGSLIKPCIVGTVARTSKPDFRSLGYSIYYALVNFGGAVGPTLASPVRTGFGIEYVFVMSAFTSFLMLLGTLLFFREPAFHDGRAPDRTRFASLFRNMMLVFTNARFMTFLVIFSGFWVMFWQIFYSFPFYVRDILKFGRFEILESVDAWTIILLSVPATALAQRMKPMHAMTLGFLIASASWLIVAAWTTVWAVIAGVALFAVGESIQAPRFYDYVGRLAPREQVGIFMGFAFLPVAIGSFIGGKLGGWLAFRYVEQTQDPWTMWTIVAGIGFISTALMLLYDRLAGARD
jgi:proton-dependent oligopeptide transporter, POT family